MKIGVFDSGIGGLTVLEKLVKQYPCNEYYYLGDNSNAPYGDKSVGQLKNLVKDDVELLLKYNVKKIVIACNTVSTTLIDYLKSEYSFVEFYPVSPKVNRQLLTAGECHLFCTVRTACNLKEKYGKLPNLKIISCRGLVEEIESKKLNFSAGLLKKYIPENRINVNQVVLGCTHYEIIKKCFISFYPSAVFNDSLGFELSGVTPEMPLDSKICFVGKNGDENYAFFTSIFKKVKNFGKKLPKRVDSGNFLL